MGYINYQHRCTTCGHEDGELHDRTEIRDLLMCPSCGDESYVRILTAHVSTSKTSVTRPERGGYSDVAGAKKDLQERQMLRKEARRLRKEGKIERSNEARKEAKRLGGK